ncbi:MULTISPECIES: hypothetical protein [Streptomyces]|uniref:hypothetical protein n=1 Tax=Streptomyces TaxID=1883 RepID=UPI002248FAAB|nr:hypothetical protein [Streptomyces sp. JHD 1]MCX2968184.1 hypothetical protein [Streptomyces sp. JHD 1]
MTDPTTVLGRLCHGLIDPAGGHFIGEAERAVPSVDPEGEPRGYSDYEPDSSKRPGTLLHSRVELQITESCEWMVRRDDGGQISRQGPDLYLDLAGRQQHQRLDTGRPEDDAHWSFWTGEWMAELLLPHRLLGLMNRVSASAAPDNGHVALHAYPDHQRVPSPYSGAAQPHVASLDLLAAPEASRLQHVTAHHADGLRDHFTLLSPFA